MPRIGKCTLQDGLIHDCWLYTSVDDSNRKLHLMRNLTDDVVVFVERLDVERIAVDVLTEEGVEDGICDGALA